MASSGLTTTGGVSIDIHNTFVSTALMGDVLEIECWTSARVHVGRSLAFTTVEIRKIVGGGNNKRVVVSTGSHTKYLR